jgi:glycosidase
VWRDERPDDGPVGLVFPGEQKEIWTYDTEAQQYYLHRFYRHQPDLNIAHEALREEIHKVIGFWLRQGLAGFRVDAVPYFIEAMGAADQAPADPHLILRELRAFVSRRRGDTVLLGEVNLPHRQQRRFFGNDDGDELHMLFNFPVMQHMYLALARQDSGPLREAFAGLPEIPPDAQWANFARNHDELTLDQLTAPQRAEVFEAFGPDADMQIYGRGLRRRLPPMLDGDEQRLRMVYSLVLSLPGTPVLFYGEEIGMGENLEVEGRLSVRTPMQWRAAEGAGFSGADPEFLTRPLVEGRFGPEHVNVADQRRRPDSFLTWMEHAIRRRKQTPEFGWGRADLVDAGDSAVFAHLCEWEGGRVLAVHNFSAESHPVSITLDFADGQFLDLLAGNEGPAMVDGSIEFDLEGFGFRWFRLTDDSRLEAP